jgi:hypothetical protein
MIMLAYFPYIDHSDLHNDLGITVFANIIGLDHSNWMLDEYMLASSNVRLYTFFCGYSVITSWYIGTQFITNIDNACTQIS